MTKGSIIFDLRNNNYYGRGTKNYALGILTAFLDADVRCFGAEDHIEMAKIGGNFWGHANITFVKMRGGIVSIGNLLDHDWETEDSCVTFDLPRDKFIYLLEKWDELTKMKVKEITITVDGENVSFDWKK